MASAIAKKTGVTAGAFGDIAANVGSYTGAQIDALIEQLISDVNAELNKRVESVTAGDNSVTIGGTAAAPTVAVKVSAAEGNLLEKAADGLKVIAPTAAEYSVAKQTTEEGFAATYQLTKDGVAVGAKINIPKDMVVQSGAVVTKDASGVWGDAGTYIELTLANNDGTKLYINVGDLIEYVTTGSAAGDMVVVSVSADHQVTATITDGTVTMAKLVSGVQDKINNGDAAKTAVDAILAGADADLKTFAAVKTALDGKQGNLSAAQLDACNSGVTAAKVTKYDGYESTIAGKQAQLTEAQLAAVNSGITAAKLEALEGLADSKQDALTEAQLAACDSGITAAKVGTYDGYAALINGKEPTLTGAKLAAVESGITATKVGTYDTLNGNVGAKVAAAAAVEIPSEDAVTLRSLRTAVVALKAAFAATAA